MKELQSSTSGTAYPLTVSNLRRMEFWNLNVFLKILKLKKTFFEMCFSLCKENMAALQDHDTVCVCVHEKFVWTLHYWGL